MAIHILVCVGLSLLLCIFYLCLNCLGLLCILPSAPGCIPCWRTGNAFAQPASDRMLASSGALLRQQHCRAGPGYLLLATLDWYLEIYFCCQEIYNCNRSNISSKQTKSCWVCFCCCLFMDARCQDWSLTVRNSMAVLQLFGSGVILCIYFFQMEFVGFVCVWRSASDRVTMVASVYCVFVVPLVRCRAAPLPPQWLVSGGGISWMLAPFPDKDDIGILVVCFVLKCPFVMFKHLFPLLR